MSDVTDIASAMGGYQAANPAAVLALEVQFASRGGRQRPSGMPTPTPLPSVLSQPTVSPLSAVQGATFTATAGSYSNASSVSRAWLLNGTPISTGLSATPSATGTLTYQETITGPGGTISSAVISATVSAVPVPAPTLNFTSPTASIAEGNSGTSTVANTINVVRDGLTGALTINLAYSGTATAGTDYVASPSSVTIAAGATSATFTTTINGDTTVESDETIVITASLAGYNATATKTITITNDDASAPTGPPPAPEISQTSTAGSAPFSWRTVNNSAYSAGMYWHVQRATSVANLNAGTLNGEAQQMIQPQDLSADSPGVVFADLGSTPTGTLALRERVGRDDGSGVLVWGDWSNVLQDTIAATFSGTLDPTHTYKDYTVSGDKLSVRAAEYPFRAASRSTVRFTSKTGYFEGLWTDASAAGDSGRIGFSSTLDPSASAAPASPGDGAPGKFVGKEGYSNGAEAFTFNGARTNGQAIGMILYENGSTRRFWVVAAEGVYPDVPTFDANQNLTSGSGFTHDQVQPYVFMCPGGGEEMKANFGGSTFQHAAKIPANVNKGIA